MPQIIAFAYLLSNCLSGKFDTNQKYHLHAIIGTGNYDEIISTLVNDFLHKIFYPKKVVSIIATKDKLFRIILKGISKQVVFHNHKDPHLTARWGLCLVVA